MKISLHLNKQFFVEHAKATKQCLVKTADAVRTDLVQSQTMPFDTGALQNRSTFVKKGKVNYFKVSIVSDTPYARRLYYHPEYNFQKDKNPNAGAKWFEPYLTGNKKDFAAKVFAKFLRERSK